MSLRVVLADDHVVLRQGVRALLERHGLEVVAEASDGRAAVDLTRQHEPDVAVLDIMMPLLNGIDAARQIVEACPETQVVMLTALEQDRLVTDAVRAGVRGFVLKTQAGEDLAQAIQQVSRGGFYVGAGVSQAVVDACRAAAAGRAARGRRQVDQGGGRAARDQPQDRRVSPLARDEEVECPRRRRPRPLRHPGRPDHALTPGLLPRGARVSPDSHPRGTGTHSWQHS